ncbi:MAG: pyridoxamine 5'-phosphate oxidase family protein [Pedococcus sp.]
MTINRTQVRRKPSRGRYQLDDAAAVLREALYGHLAFVQDGQPYCIPMGHALIDDTLYLHGSSASRAVRIAGAGAALCYTVTLVDGVVVSKSMVNSSLNYRSCLVLGAARLVTEADEVAVAYHAVIDAMIPGRRGDVRPPSEQDLQQTGFLALPLDEFSVKVRSGGPNEDVDDEALPHWSGVVPVRTVFGVPEPAVDDAPALPPYLDPYARPDGLLP